MDSLLNLFEGDWLPYVFAFLLGFSLLVYVCLDGYDLGVGILSLRATDAEKDKMIASVAPFWDANETWLVLGGGLMLVGFPLAQGIVFQNLYIPMAVMLIGLILRGVSFDFRGKVPPEKKNRWNLCFAIGSLMTVLAQGYMLGRYFMGFSEGASATLLACLMALMAVFAVSLIGGGWLLMKTEGDLQRKAVKWTGVSLAGLCALLIVSGITAPLMSDTLRAKWIDSGLGTYILLFLLALIVIGGIFLSLRMLKNNPQRRSWVPFALTIGLFVLNFGALSMTFYPWIIVDKLDLVNAAASRESLMVVLVGTVITLPILIAYTVIVYRIFHGKVKDLSYE